MGSRNATQRNAAASGAQSAVASTSAVLGSAGDGSAATGGSIGANGVRVATGVNEGLVIATVSSVSNFLPPRPATEDVERLK